MWQRWVNRSSHQLILELYDRLDALEALVAQLQRELYGPRRERFIAEESEAPADVDHDLDRDADIDGKGDVGGRPPRDAQAITPSADDSSMEVSQGLVTPLAPSDNPESSGGKTRRTSSGRQPRVHAPDTPRERIYHSLNEQEVPPEILHHPRARRFFRFVREELELPQRRVRILEHYQEVIVVDDPVTLESALAVCLSS